MNAKSPPLRGELSGKSVQRDSLKATQKEPCSQELKAEILREPKKAGGLLFEVIVETLSSAITEGGMS